MDKAGMSVVAMVLTLLIVVVAFPMVSQAADTSLEGSNEDPLYSMERKALTDTVVLSMDQGALTMDGETFASLGFSGTVMVMSDVLTMVVDADTGGYTAWSTLLEESGCKADSTSTLVYTFDEAHLTITDSEDPEFGESSWYRYLLVPSAEGPLGVWEMDSLPSLVLDSDAFLYISEASGDDAGTVYGTMSNLAAGQNVADGARVYGSASAIYGPVLNGTAYSVSSLDTDGGIVGDGAYVACEKTYTYATEAGLAVGTILGAAAIMIFLIAIAAIVRCLK